MKKVLNSNVLSNCSTESELNNEHFKHTKHGSMRRKKATIWTANHVRQRNGLQLFPNFMNIAIYSH